jgi:hypothetical protein
VIRKPRIINELSGLSWWVTAQAAGYNCRQEHRASEHELLQRIKVLRAADIALAKAQAAKVDQK